MQQAPPAPKPADLVTLCQVDLNFLSERLYSTIGELQRDAPPRSVAGEDIVEPPAKAYDPAARAKGFADELVTVTKRLEALVQRLPPPMDEQEQYARITKLQQRSQQLSDELENARGLAEIKLQQATDMYACLARAKLQHPNT